MVNSRKLLHLNWATGKKALGENTTVCEACGPPIHNHHAHLLRWVELIKTLFGRSCFRNCAGKLPVPTYT